MIRVIAVISAIVWISQGELCTNIPPGLGRASLGLDITCLEMEPTDLTAPDGHRGKLVDFTCNEGKVWVNPYNNVTYQVPDQVSSIVSVPGGLMNAVSNIYRNCYEYRNHLCSSSSTRNEDAQEGMFSQSSSYLSMSESFSSSSSEVVDISTYVSAIEATMVPGELLGLTEDARQFVEALPNAFSDDPDAYFKFISYFGTHFFVKTNFGGYIRAWFYVDSSYYLSHSESETTANSYNYYYDHLYNSQSGSKDRHDWHSNSNGNFRESMRMTTMYHGGQVSMLHGGQLSEWEKTVPGNPGLLGGSLVPIYTMINNDSEKQAAMKEAVDVHLKKAYLKEVLRMVYNAALKYIMVDTTTLERLVEEGEALLNAQIPDCDNVTRYGEEVNFHLVKPLWWVQTRFCFNPRAQTESLHCYEWNAPYCAHPYSFTSPYTDQTHSQEHSCQLSWGLFTPVYADQWFRNIQLCFRSQATGDASQCGNGDLMDETCAPVNSYTQEYLDATSDLVGGCSLAWKLKVGDDAPYWFLNTQLCLSFWGDRNHCSGPDHRNRLCASPNEWTPDFHEDSRRDNSTFYYHGCTLQWAILEQLN